MANIVTDRLANRMIHYPVVGLPIRWAANLLNVAILAGAKLSGRLIGYDNDAVMWYIPLHPSPATPTDRVRDYLPRVTALFPLLPGYLLAVAAAVTLDMPAVSGILLCLTFVYALWSFAGVLARKRRGNTTRIVGRVRRLFDGTDVTLVLVCGPARARHASAYHCAVAMLLAIRHAADDQQVTIVADAATSGLAALYQRHGFVPLPTGERHLVRAPARAAIPASDRP